MLTFFSTLVIIMLIEYNLRGRVMLDCTTIPDRWYSPRAIKIGMIRCDSGADGTVRMEEGDVLSDITYVLRTDLPDN